MNNYERKDCFYKFTRALCTGSRFDTTKWLKLDSIWKFFILGKFHSKFIGLGLINSDWSRVFGGNCQILGSYAKIDSIYREKATSGIIKNFPENRSQGKMQTTFKENDEKLRLLKKKACVPNVPYFLCIFFRPLSLKMSCYLRR